jgi:hypothetical protein
MHPPDRERDKGWPVALKRQSQRRPVTGGQRDLPVYPGCPAAGVALAYLPHADQRVGAAAQHQFLEIADLFPVARLRRLEDPLP